jgi:hypothetical protein
MRARTGPNQDQYRLRIKFATPLLAAGRAELADGKEAQALGPSGEIGAL